MKKRVARITIRIDEGKYDIFDIGKPTGEHYIKYRWHVDLPKQYVIDKLYPSGYAWTFDHALSEAKEFIQLARDAHERAKKFPYVEEVEL
jgi:hypothetical protein